MREREGGKKRGSRGECTQQKKEERGSNVLSLPFRRRRREEEENGEGEMRRIAGVKGKRGGCA